MRVVILLACILGLSAADASTVGASATELRNGLHITNTDIGLLVAVTSLVAALATLPFGVLADRVRRTWVLGAVIVMWGAAMLWSASVGDFGELLLARVFLGGVTAAAGPLVASLIGDYFLPVRARPDLRLHPRGRAARRRVRIRGHGRHRDPFLARGVRHPRAARRSRSPSSSSGCRSPSAGGGDPLCRAGDARRRRNRRPQEAEPASTDAQRLAEERGIAPDPELTLTRIRSG